MTPICDHTWNDANQSSQRMGGSCPACFESRLALAENVVEAGQYIVDMNHIIPHGVPEFLEALAAYKLAKEK